MSYQHIKVTCGRIVSSLRPRKEETHRTRLAVDGNFLDYDGDDSIPTSDIITTNIHFNSAISTKNAKFATTDIKNFYLNNFLPKSEWMKLLMFIILYEIIQRYNLNNIAEGGWVYIEISKGMYGLKQSGHIVHDELVKHLLPYRYTPSKRTPGI